MKKFVSFAIVITAAIGLGFGALVWGGVVQLHAPVAVSGKVTRAGQPLAFEEGGYMVVLFAAPIRETSDPVYQGQCDIATSTFKIPAIPPGRYEVAIHQFDLHSMDALGHSYTFGSNRLFVDVTHDGQVFDFDLPEVLPPRNTASAKPADGASGPKRGPRPPKNDASAPAGIESAPAPRTAK